MKNMQPLSDFWMKDVIFFYNDNMVFLKNDYRFDSFLSLLDYYAYIVAGYDEDSYFVKGGTNIFKKLSIYAIKLRGALADGMKQEAVQSHQDFSLFRKFLM
ncbi:MAG: DUF4835 family protein [Ignavibacteria bacterium]|nr:DUF4835 family protein [Ignavibacteria bacterium]